MAAAEALRLHVEALNEQNQAAILDTALAALPQIAGKLFEAYGRIGNVTYIAAGEGDGVTSRITQDIVGMVPLLGAVFESTTGLKLHDLMVKQNGVAGAPTVQANGHGTTDAGPTGEVAENNGKPAQTSGAEVARTDSTTHEESPAGAIDAPT
jgi:uncharacterized membrane protein YqiK